MFAQFRNHYPTGSLISELVKINQGIYVVRASVIVDGVTLATGLAADDAIEIAENRARIRALEVLSIQPIAPGRSASSEISRTAPSTNNTSFSPDLFTSTSETKEIPEGVWPQLPSRVQRQKIGLLLLGRVFLLNQIRN